MWVSLFPSKIDHRISYPPAYHSSVSFLVNIWQSMTDRYWPDSPCLNFPSLVNHLPAHTHTRTHISNLTWLFTEIFITTIFPATNNNNNVVITRLNHVNRYMTSNSQLWISLYRQNISFTTYLYIFQNYCHRNRILSSQDIKAPRKNSFRVFHLFPIRLLLLLRYSK